MDLFFVKDFTDCPGGRYKEDGENSGEEFYNEILYNKFHDLNENDTLTIYLDDVYGYPITFIDEVFFRLTKDFGCKILEKLRFVTEYHFDTLVEIYRTIFEYLKHY